jgi:uncharacterized protein YceK
MFGKIMMRYERTFWRVIAGWVLVFVLLAGGGCASLGEHVSILPVDPAVKPGPYPGVRLDAERIAGAAHNMFRPTHFYDPFCHLGLGLLVLLDMPFSVLLDTFFLPSDLKKR